MSVTMNVNVFRVSYHIVTPINNIRYYVILLGLVTWSSINCLFDIFDKNDNYLISDF